MTFDDFTKTHPTCSVVRDSLTARQIYDDIIWDEQNRIKMAELSDLEIPALVAVADQIIDHCQSQPDCDIQIANETVKQVIGRMISVALEPLGYAPNKKKRMPQKKGQDKTDVSASAAEQVFKNATAFAKSGPSREQIVKHIEKL